MRASSCEVAAPTSGDDAEDHCPDDPIMRVVLRMHVGVAQRRDSHESGARLTLCSAVTALCLALAALPEEQKFL